MKIGIFGGSFDPPHKGHSRLLDNFINFMQIDRTIVIPTYMPPHKELSGRAGAADRFSMAKLAFERENVEISDIEIKRGGISYTADTIAELKRKYPEDELYLLVGGDMLMSFEHWNQPEKILENAVLVAAPREMKTVRELKKKATALMKLYGGKIVVMNCIPIPASSTDIRLIYSDIKIFQELLDRKVYDYIEKKKLYTTHGLIDEYMNKLKAMLSSERYCHSIGVMDTAVKLARIHGCDAEKARIAGLLHDITKEMPFRKQLEMAEDYGICIDKEEADLSKIYHSRTGAMYVKHELGIDDEEILSAIECHTCGKADMRLLDKIIYVSDHIDPTRNYRDINYVRKLAGKDLDKAVYYCLCYCLSDLVRKKSPIAHDSVCAYNAYSRKFRRLNGHD